MRTLSPHHPPANTEITRDPAAALLAAIPDPFLALDPDGVVTYANPAARTALGGDLLGCPLWEASHDPGLLALRGMVTRALHTGAAGTLEVQAGTVGRWYQVQAFRYDDGAALRFADVTGRRSSELRSRRDRNRTSALMDQMSAGLVVTSLDGVVLEANARFLEMTGLTRGEVIGSRRPHPWWSPADSDAYERRLDLRAWRTKASHVETVFRTKDGREFPARVGVSALVDRDGTPEAVIKTIVDIGEEHRARQMLGRSEAEFRLLAEQTADLICRHDRDGRMLYVSPASRTVLGTAPFAARGRRLEDFAHGPDRPVMATAFADVIADGRDRTVVVRGRRSAGERAWLETTVRRVADAPGGEQLISATRDVTSRHLTQLIASAATRVTDAAATGRGVAEVVEAITVEARRLLDVEAAVVWHFAGDHAVAVAASGSDAPAPGTRVALRGGSGAGFSRRAEAAAAALRDCGARTTLAAPVTVQGRVWGALVVGMRERTEVSEQLERLLARMSELASTGVARAEASAELTFRAERDPLTGIANRAVFDDRIADAAARGQRVALCLVDIDHFKAVNDTHGHDAGDEVLRRVAGRLQEAARRGDLVARVGGEEFAWLMPATSLDDAVRAADRARMLIAGTTIDPVGSVTVSAGLAAAEAGHWSPSELFRTSDRALYAAKRSGRDRVVGLPG
ncbi:MAG: diguanylate cyclase [Thermoleophilia bacterium]|nr:diguanylate cyclase [Thermoleophilia bacterium]